MSAVDLAVAHMLAVQFDYGRVPVPMKVLLDSIPADVLHKVADERMMAKPDSPRVVP